MSQTRKGSSRVLRSLLLTLLSWIVFFSACSSQGEDVPEKINCESRPIRFAVVGDSRGPSHENPVNEDILGKIVNALLIEPVDFVLFGGDQIFGHPDRQGLGDEGALAKVESELRQWLAVMQPLYDSGIFVFNVRGNHEMTQFTPNHEGYPDHRPVWPSVKGVWDSVFSGRYAMPDNGPAGEENTSFYEACSDVLIVGLDNYTVAVPGAITNPDGSINNPYFHHVHQAWLDDVLDSYPRSHVFVFSHEPAFKVEHSDCLHGDMAPGIDVDYYQDRDAFWNSLRAAGARAFFGFHDHGYAHARIDDGDGNPGNDIHQFVAGTAGAGKQISPQYDGFNGAFTPVGIYSESSYGYLTVEILEGAASITWKRMYDEQQGLFESAEVFSW